MKEKSITFCFLKLKAKEKTNFSKINGGRVTFLWEIYVSSFEVNVYSRGFLLKPHSWSGGNLKRDITRNWTYDLPHELLNNLGLMILRNEELLRLFTWVFINLMIRGFELVTRGFELVTRGFELVTRGFELALLNFNS